MNLTDLFDTYSYQARLQPALLVLSPLFVTIIVWVPAMYQMASALSGLVAACGVVVYLAHLSRALGRKVEPCLYAKWGGKPTTLWLSHNDHNLDAQTKARYHTFLEKHVAGWTAPTLEEEARDVQSAKIVYDSAVRWLREKTRDRKRYDLIFKENVSYGFRRNLYGLRPVGLLLSFLCMAGNISALYYTICVASAAIKPEGFASLAWNLAVVTGLIASVRESWVKDAAESYARALLAACD